MKNKYAIIGYGGFAREVFTLMKQNSIYSNSNIEFYVDDEYMNYNPYSNEHNVNKLSSLNLFDTDVYIIVACGEPNLRERIVNKLTTINNNICFPNIFDKSVVQYHDIEAGLGNIFCRGSILTTNIEIGNFNIFNLNTTVGHDCIIGDYNTFSPASNISGNVTIGDNCYFGTNCAVREKITIGSNTTIGMGAVVVKSIYSDVKKTYIGNPAKLM